MASENIGITIEYAPPLSNRLFGSILGNDKWQESD